MTARLRVAYMRALAEAEQRRAELSTNGAAPRRLRLEAQEAAGSPLAHDQLMALALMAMSEGAGVAVAPLHLLRSPPDPLEQLERREAALTASDPQELVDDVDAAAGAEEERGLELARQTPCVPLVEHLQESAALNRLLWDHPYIPATDATRAAMLLVAARLEARAEGLSLNRPADPLPSPDLGDVP